VKKRRKVMEGEEGKVKKGRKEERKDEERK
jgi:hypothetical protein